MRHKHLQRQFLTGAEASRSVGIATYLGLVAAFVPSIGGLVTAIQSRGYLAATAWGIFLLTVTAWALKSIVRHPYRPLPPSNRFQPFAEPSELTPWPRTGEVQRIRRALDTTEVLPVVVGPSGAGKTTILRTLLPDALNGDHRHHYVDQYGDFFDSFPELVEKLEADTGRARKTIIVLDQFEQLLAQLDAKPPSVRERREQELSNLTERARLAGAKLIVSVRYEWFYALRVLGSPVPAPSQCIDIRGPKPYEYDDPTLKAILKNLKGALRDDEELARYIITELGERGSLLLLETQIVGATIESLLADGQPITREYLRDDLGGVRGAIERYFDDVLASAPDRRVALKVLAALSTATRFRRQVNREDILDVVFEEPEAVAEAIAFLQDRKLVIDRDGWSQFELSHDFIAEYFHSRCGNELRPTDRDNVTFHLEAGPNHMGKLVRSRRQREHTRGTLGWAIFGFLVISMFARLLGFGIPWTQLGSLDPQYSTNRVFDAAYVPVFLAHGAWSIYITLFYVRIFAMLNERTAARLFSQAVPLFMAACVVVAYFIPYAWMCSIGLGGMLLAGKLISLSHNHDLGAGARARVGEFGRTTMAALIFLTILGAAGMWASFALQSHPDFEQRWIAISLFASLTMTLPCLVLAPYHVRRPAVSEFLGLLARSPRGIVPRTGV